MATSTGNNPALTAEQVQKILVAPLEDKSVFLSAGPRIFDTNGSPVRVPLLVGMSEEPTWVGENELIPSDTELETDEVTLLPEGMKSIKTISRFSNELARQSIVALDVAIKDRLVSDVANKLDNALISSTVTNGTVPRGLLSYQGVQEMTGVGTLELDDLLDAIGLMFAANVDTSRLKWFMRSEVFVHLRKLKDGDDRYQLQPDPTLAGAFTLFGIPVVITNRLPTSTNNATPPVTSSSVVLADFSTIAVARDLAPSVTILTERYADYDQIGIRVTTRYDAAPLLPEGVLILRGVTT